MRWDAVKHALDADVLVNVWPVHSLAYPDETEIGPLFWGGL